MTIDRRRFLGVAGAGGALVAGGGLDAILGRPIDASPAPRAQAPAQAGRAPDVLVIGAGAFGGWTALHLRRMGVNVTLIDAFGPGNSRATSGDETRGVRSSYGSNALWIRLANEAIRRWKAFDEEWSRPTKARLFYDTGDIILRPAWDNNQRETIRNWDALGVPYELLTVEEVRYRWPNIRTDGMRMALYEASAGVVRSRRACEVVWEVFRQAGGETAIARAAPGRRAGDRLLDVALESGGTMTAGQFVFACGPWLPKLFPDTLGNRMRIPMGSVFYFGTPPGDNRFTHPNMPSWSVPGVTGWPALGPDNRGFRVRTGGNAGGDDPDTSVRWIAERFHTSARRVLREFFPAMREAPLLETRACHYESSSNRNFIIDRHPDYSNVWISGAGQAEGFKFGPVNGEYTARRVTGDQDDPEFDRTFAFPTEEYEGGGGFGGGRGRGGGAAR